MNVGAGPAVNAFQVSDPGADMFDARPFGAIPQGQFVPVPDALQRELYSQVRDPMGRRPVYVVSEPVVAGDWMLSTNRVSSNGRITHSHEKSKPNKCQFKILMKESTHDALNRYASELEDTIGL